VKKKPKLEKILIGDIPKSVHNSIGSRISNYSVNIISLRIENNLPVEKLIGSGTLIQAGEKKGILTAQHVVDSTSFLRAERIGFSLKDRPHKFHIDKGSLDIIRFGNEQREIKEPDIAYLGLLSPEIGWIDSIKSFWNLGSNIDDALAIDTSSDLGMWVIYGCPDEYTEIVDINSTFEKTISFMAISGASGIVKTRFDKGGLDYIDVSLTYDNEERLPSTFGGVSGGGLWHVVLCESKERNIFSRWPTFCGIAFAESPIVDNERLIHCYGPETIYRYCYEKLKKLLSG
jgi:hypothetical protein